jgi:hypothetical protein
MKGDFAILLLSTSAAYRRMTLLEARAYGVSPEELGGQPSSKAVAQAGGVKGTSSILLAVELHGRWHVMTPSIELRDGVCL